MATIFVNSTWTSDGLSLYYTTSPEGVITVYSDSGDGRTSATGYKSIASAIGAAAADDIIMVYGDKLGDLSTENPQSYAGYDFSSEEVQKAPASSITITASAPGQPVYINRPADANGSFKFFIKADSGKTVTLKDISFSTEESTITSKFFDANKGTIHFLNASFDGTRNTTSTPTWYYQGIRAALGTVIIENSSIKNTRVAVTSEGLDTSIISVISEKDLLKNVCFEINRHGTLRFSDSTVKYGDNVSIALMELDNSNPVKKVKLLISDSDLEFGMMGRSSGLAYNKLDLISGSTLSLSNSTLKLGYKASSEAEVTCSAVANAGTVSIANSTLWSGAITNTGTITVDALSSIHSAGGITNTNGTINLTFTGKNTGCITVTNPSPFDVTGNGTINIDLSKCNFAGDSIDLFTCDTTAGINLKVNGQNAADGYFTTDYLNYSRDETTGTITITKGTKRKVLFVNTSWSKDNVKTKDPIVWNDANYKLYYGFNAFDRVQDAINAAEDGDTIVFWGTSIDFLSQKLITIDKDLTFETTTREQCIAVKIDMIKVNEGATATFRNGVYSLEDYLDNDGTLKITANTRFNANLIGNEGGTVIVDTTSRLVADAIEDGNVQLHVMYPTMAKDPSGNDLDPWIIRSVAALASDTVIELDLPSYDSSTGDYIYTRYTSIRSGDRIYRLVDAGGNAYYYVGRRQNDGTFTYDGKPAEVSGTISGWDCTTEYGGVFIISDVFDLRETSAGSGQYWSNAIYVDNSFSPGTTSFTTDNGKTVKATFANGSETADSTGATGVYAFKSFVTAYNSKYVKNHAIRTKDGSVYEYNEKPGMRILVRAGDYDYSGSGTANKLSTSLEGNICVTPDKTNGKDYDHVTMILGGLKTKDSAHTMEFAYLDALTIGGKAPSQGTSSQNWEFGSDSGKVSTVTFYDIGSLTVNGTLKALGGGTIRIINCEKVVSNKHFTVTGGTLIIDSSNIELNGALSDSGEVNGALSTQNNEWGGGTVIVRNSSMKVNSEITGGYVNLKGGSEFMISGMSTVSGVFTNAADNTDTRISFSNATLDENTIIKGDPDKEEKGAALFFEGYNTLNGSSIEQLGDKGMTVDSGATLNMSNSAAISVGGNVQISNAGNITLEGSGTTLTAGSLVNIGNMTITDGASITLGNGSGTLTNGPNGVLTVDLASDGTLGINGNILNRGVVNIDLSNTDFPENDLYIDLSGLTNDGGSINIVGGGGEVEEPGGDHSEGYRINLNFPQTRTLYVNRTWIGNDKGKNVGSYTYLGYNAFADNSDTGSVFKNLTFYADGEHTEQTKEVIFYGGKSYTALNLTTANAPAELTIRTVEGTGTGASTVTMAPLTVGTQNVSLSGTTMSLNSVTVNSGGTLNAIAGESGRLTLSVAKSANNRDVTVEVFTGSGAGAKSEYRTTVHVSADTSEIAVKSGKLAIGSSYTVKVSDLDRYVTVSDTTAATEKLVVNLAANCTSDMLKTVTVKDDMGAKFTFAGTSLQFAAGSGTTPPTVSVIPDFSNSNSSVSLKRTPGESDTGTISASINDSGLITLTVTGIVSAQNVGVTVTHGGSQFDYNFTVEAQTSATKTYTVSTRFDPQNYYYVNVDTESSGVTAEVDSIADSAVTAQGISNSGTLNVASVISTASGDSPAAKLVLNVNRLASAERWIEVTYSYQENEENKVLKEKVFVDENATTADFASTLFRAGSNYDGVTISDKYNVTLTAAAGAGSGDPSCLTLTGLATDGRTELIITVKDGASVVKEYKLSDGDFAITEGSVTLSSSKFVAGRNYTVIVNDSRSMSGLAARTLNTLTATEVTNEGTVNVTDADFIATSVDTTSHTFNVSGYSTLKGPDTTGETPVPTALSLTGTVTLANGATLANSNVSGGSISTSGAVTVKDSTIGTAAFNATGGDTAFTGANRLNGVMLDATGKAVTNNGAITMDAASLITAGSINNTGTITVDATGYNIATNGMKKVIDLAGSGVSITGTSATATGIPDATLYHKADESDYYLVDVGRSTVYVDSDWDIGAFGVTAKLKQGATPVEKRYSLYNAFKSVDAAADKAASIGAELVIQDAGDQYEGVIQLQNVTTTITREEGSSGTPSFKNAIYGGIKATEGTGVLGVAAGNSIHIENGTFNKFVAGGSNINMSTATTAYVINGKDNNGYFFDPESPDTTKTYVAHTLVIDDGTFGSESTGIVAGGERFQRGDLTVYGDINTTINGGEFKYRVAGGIMNLANTDYGKAFIKGNVNLTINGGTFDNDSHNVWIYGGCISSQKGSDATGVSSKAEIHGNVTITVNAASTLATPITFCSIVVGSHGWGEIKKRAGVEDSGNAKLVFTGDGSKITFAEGAQIWGSSSGDNLDQITGKIETPTVAGKRTLSFTGFTNTLACEKIGGFSHIEFTGNSTVTLNSNCNLSDAENWTFEKGSTLSGSFANDFTGDIINLKDFTTAGTYTLLTDTVSDENDVFNGFGALSDIQIGDVSVTSKSYNTGTRTWSWSAGSTAAGSLAIVDGTGDNAGKRFMQLTLLA